MRTILRSYRLGNFPKFWKRQLRGAHQSITITPRTHRTTARNTHSYQSRHTSLVTRHPAGIVILMHREPISTSNAPAAIGPYSQAIRAEGKFLFLSGQIALRPDGTLVEGDVKAQTEQVLTNIKAVLAEAGLEIENVVKTTIFLKTMDDFAAMNEVYGSVFSNNPPARSTVAAAGLPRNVDVEIETIAVY